MSKCAFQCPNPTWQPGIIPNATGEAQFASPLLSLAAAKTVEVYCDGEWLPGVRASRSLFSACGQKLFAGIKNGMVAAGCAGWPRRKWRCFRDRKPGLQKARFLAFRERAILYMTQNRGVFKKTLFTPNPLIFIRLRKKCCQIVLTAKSPLSNSCRVFGSVVND
jgi:hypothetical protein